MQPERILKIANWILITSVGIFTLSLYVGYIDPDSFSLGVQIASHIITLLSTVGIKFGYVMRLNACFHLKIEDFAPEEPEQTSQATFVYETENPDMQRISSSFA